MTTNAARRIVVVAILAALAWPGSGAPVSARQSSGAQQRWFELYDDAIRDIQAKRFTQAETKLLAAKKTGPPPGRNVLRFGSTRDDFFPDYYLGIVYQNTKRPKEALAAFQLARNQKINTADSEFAQIDQFEKLARADVAVDPTPVDPAWYTLYEEAAAHLRNREWPQAETKLQTARKTGPLPGRDVLRYGTLRADFFPDYYLGVVYQNTNRYSEAVSAFSLARDQGAEGVVKDFGTVASLLAAAQAEVGKVNAAATKKEFDGLLQTANQQFMQANYGGAMSTVAKARALSPGSAAEVDKLVSQMETLLVTGIESDLAQRNAAAAGQKYTALIQVNPVSQFASALDKKIKDLGASATTRLQLERNVMRSYFQGSYSEVSVQLQVGANADTLSPRASFYLACSLAALAHMTNPTSASQLNQARRYYKAAMSDSSGFSQDLKYISPKILRELQR